MRYLKRLITRKSIAFKTNKNGTCGKWEVKGKLRKWNREAGGKLKMTEDRENSGPGDGNPSLLLRSEMGVCEGYPGSSRKFPALLTREKPGYGCCCGSEPARWPITITIPPPGVHALCNLLPHSTRVNVYDQQNMVEGDDMSLLILGYKKPLWLLSLLVLFNHSPLGTLVSWAALRRGPRGKELKPSANNHTNELRRGSSGHNQVCRDCSSGL